jgi:two-component system sensor histidine kinase MprB
MSFRLRLTVLASLAVAVAIVGTSFVVYYTDKRELLHQVDNDLRVTLTVPQVRTTIKGKPASRLLRSMYFSKVGPRGAAVTVIAPGSRVAVGVQLLGNKQVRGFVASPPRFVTTDVGGVRSRALTLATPLGKLILSRPLASIDSNLRHLRWALVLVSLGGIGVAALLGALVSGTAVAPLRRLTETTDRIVETGDLSRRIGSGGRDEISRLSRRLDELLETLDESLRAQRQLVADASHELRTPIATLRANVELLADSRTLDAEEREEIVADVHDELESMTALVGELVELARGEEADVVASEFRLDEVVQAAVDRAARRAPGVDFRTELEPTTVTGVPERVERAVANLLDNARKWSPPHEPVVVVVRDGLVEVRDHGPGIDAEDVPLLFNRFYRSKKARGMPGAGLGLAIVKQIADAHGGSVTVDRAGDGGAIFRLQLAPSS